MHIPFDSTLIDEAPFSSESKRLVKLLLQKEQNLRPSAEEALAHPWLTSSLEEIENQL